MSILNILIYILGGIAICIYGFFAIKKYKKWKNLTKQYIANGQELETAKANAYKEIYKKKSKKAESNEIEDTPFEE